MWYKFGQNSLGIKNPPTILPQAPQSTQVPLSSLYDPFHQQQTQHNFNKLINPQPYKMQMNATAYCGCAKCCKYSGRLTASGTKPVQGRTVAVPPSIHFGTKIEIPGMGTYVAEDRGGAIQGNHLDIYFSNHQDALNFGRKMVEATIYPKIV